ncbi:MAG: hypothetical protein ACP5Q1_07905 [Anaerolineae bacterium]
MNSESVRKVRPYWHVDAKWVAGLLLVAVLSATLLVFNLVQLTAEQPATEIMATTIATLFSRRGLDDESEIAQMRLALRASPDGTLQPIPGLPIVIREKDIAGLSPRQIRLYAFRQLATPLYRKGAAGLAAQITDPEARKSLAGGIGILELFTLKTHQNLRRVFLLLVGACLVLLIPLVFFSYRFGRLGSPGVVLFASSLPGAAISSLLWTVVQNQEMPAPPGEGGSLIGLLNYTLANILPHVVPIVARNYLIALVLGFALILLAVLGSLLWRLTRAKG